MGWEVLGCVFVESKEEKLEAWAMRSRRSSRRVGLGSCSVTQSCLTLCNPMDYSTPGFLVLHGLPELAQTHDHWVGDAIQPPHPLSPPSPLALNLSQHQSKWIQSTFKKPNFSKKYTNGTVLWSCVYRWVNFHKLNTPRGWHPDWATEHLAAC